MNSDLPPIYYDFSKITSEEIESPKFKKRIKKELEGKDDEIILFVFKIRGKLKVYSFFGLMAIYMGKWNVFILKEKMESILIEEKDRYIFLKLINRINLDKCPYPLNLYTKLAIGTFEAKNYRWWS